MKHLKIFENFEEKDDMLLDFLHYYYINDRLSFNGLPEELIQQWDSDPQHPDSYDDSIKRIKDFLIFADNEDLVAFDEDDDIGYLIDKLVSDYEVALKNGETDYID